MAMMAAYCCCLGRGYKLLKIFLELFFVNGRVGQKSLSAVLSGQDRMIWCRLPD
jgi:hypothetical protein